MREATTRTGPAVVGFWARGLANLIDGVLVLAITLPILISFYGWEYFKPGAYIKPAPMGLLISWVLPAAAVILFWIFRSATPGKMVISARIVDARTGDKPSAARLIGRFFAYFLSWIPFGLGFVWVGLDQRKQGWHDKLAGTAVVRSAVSGRAAASPQGMGPGTSSVIALLAGIVAFLLNALVALLTALDSVFSIFFVPGFLMVAISASFGHSALRRVRRSKGMLRGTRSSTGGLVLGYSGLSVAVLCIFTIFALPKALFAVSSRFMAPNCEIFLYLEDTPGTRVTSEITQQTMKVLSSRLRSLGVPHTFEEMALDRIVVRLRLGDTFNIGKIRIGEPTGEGRVQAIERIMLSRTLRFHLVHEDNESLVAEMGSPGFIPPGGFRAVNLGGESLFVEAEPVLVNGVDHANVRYNSATSSPVVAIRFGDEGREALARVTRENIGRRLAIMVDAGVYAAPVINEPITGGALILTGDFTREEAGELVVSLRSGTVPVRVLIGGVRYPKN